MGMDDVAHLGGGKSVGILKSAKVPFPVILGILRIVVFERIPTALDGCTGCPLRYTARDKITRYLIPRKLDPLIMFWSNASTRMVLGLYMMIWGCLFFRNICERELYSSTSIRVFNPA